MTVDEAPGQVRRGELRIYPGAAPGVGKTYAMLGEGHRRLERGTDVVVGLVETHGRGGVWLVLADDLADHGAVSTWPRMR